MNFVFLLKLIKEIKKKRYAFILKPITVNIYYENHNLPWVPHFLLLKILNLWSSTFTFVFLPFYKSNPEKCNKKSTIK